MKFFGKNVYVKRSGALPTIGVSVSDSSIIASAAEDDSDAPKSGKCVENVTWIFDDNGTLTISGTGEMKNYYKSSLRPWEKDINFIESSYTSIN